MNTNRVYKVASRLYLVVVDKWRKSQVRYKPRPESQKKFRHRTTSHSTDFAEKFQCAPHAFTHKKWVLHMVHTVRCSAVLCGARWVRCCRPIFCRQVGFSMLSKSLNQIKRLYDMNSGFIPVYPTHHWKQGNIIMTNWCVQEITFYRIQRALHNGIFFNIWLRALKRGCEGALSRFFS